jgi:hypothetical protein
MIEMDEHSDGHSGFRWFEPLTDALSLKAAIEDLDSDLSSDGEESRCQCERRTGVVSRREHGFSRILHQSPLWGVAAQSSIVERFS